MSLLFDGVDNYATLPAFANPSSGSWTVAMAFQAEDNGALLSQVGTTQSIAWLTINGGSLFSLVGTTNLVLAGVSFGTWYLAYVRRDVTGGGQLRLNLRRTGSNQSTANNSTAKFVELGFYVGSALGTGSFLDGKIAWMGHWNRALSDAEMTTVFDYVKAYLADRESISL